ncbi:hypothetical protein HMPREF1581_01456 [Gardnerella vaginalis JCP8108]|uniref:Uncharacterized protein n=1 Tax=Gardnerella vaginalis JCP8108 TaxID=1261066 RepID=S4GTM5_GARVA|nr:hypothetical protein HMPREF1581_01456 [Gardnerella vaginalis JCP8108]
MSSLVSFPKHDSTNHDGEFNKKKDESKAKTSINSMSNYIACAQQARPKSDNKKKLQKCRILKVCG